MNQKKSRSHLFRCLARLVVQNCSVPRSLLPPMQVDFLQTRHIEAKPPSVAAKLPASADSKGEFPPDIAETLSGIADAEQISGRG